MSLIKINNSLLLVVREAKTAAELRLGDLDKKFGQMVENFLNQFDDRLKDYNDLLSSNQIFLTRTKGLGVISPQAALDWGLTGPNLRASGINYDVRKAMPYSSYEKFQFNVPLGN